MGLAARLMPRCQLRDRASSCQAFARVTLERNAAVALELCTAMLYVSITAPRSACEASCIRAHGPSRRRGSQRGEQQRRGLLPRAEKAWLDDALILQGGARCASCCRVRCPAPTNFAPLFLSDHHLLTHHASLLRRSARRSGPHGRRARRCAVAAAPAGAAGAADARRQVQPARAHERHRAL